MIRNCIICVLGVCLFVACTANLKATDIETGVTIDNPMKDCGKCEVQNVEAQEIV